MAASPTVEIAEIQNKAAAVVFQIMRFSDAVPRSLRVCPIRLSS